MNGVLRYVVAGTNDGRRDDFQAPVGEVQEVAANKLPIKNQPAFHVRVRGLNFNFVSTGMAPAEAVREIAGSVGEVARRLRVFEELLRLALAAGGPRLLIVAELRTTNFAGNGFRQLAEFQPADALVRRQVLPDEDEDFARHLRTGAVSGGRVTNALGTARRTGSGLGTTAASATAGCWINTLSSSKGLTR